MKLRTQISLFFFIFALAPLLTAVMINLPLVLERMELFYHKAYLQNLRNDFRDLDQHLASRNEMVRLLAKLPEPGAILGKSGGESEEQIDLARTRYIQWMNQILKDQLDIVQIVFLDQDGREQFWLDRDRASQEWQPTVQRPRLPPSDFFKAVMNLEYGQVLVSPISLDPEAGAVDPRRFMNLRLVSPIISQDGNSIIGAAMINIDVGGMARYYRDTLWVNNDGSFLEQPDPSAPSGDAFQNYPGLKPLFAKAVPALWKDDGQQIMWVPMFRTEQAGALWVGRPVDPSPISQFRNELTLRVLSIVFILIIVTLLAARWLAKRIASLSSQITDGIEHILKNEGAVAFRWRGPQELQKLGKNLSRLAIEHTKNTQDLRAHAKELEESNRYKSQFLANVSHELRTPLNSILLLSKLLSEEQSGLGKEQMKQAKVINEAGSDLQALIDNILDLSRIEAGRTPIHLEKIELPDLLAQLHELVLPQFEAKKLPLKLVISDAAPRQVISDSDKLRQIIKNFLANALKFTESGVVNLRLDGETASEGGRFDLRISVEDSGIGIPATKHDKIFDAFRQADGATNRRYGGTGLGLTISRQLARLLGGEIQLQSQEGFGSTFSLLLPLEPPAHPEGEESREAGSVEEPLLQEHAPTIDAHLGDYLVLVVDSDIHNLLMITPLLESWGLRVIGAGDSEEVLEVLNEETTDLSIVLIDVMMPELEGCDTIKLIKSQENPLHIIALVKESDTTAVAACLDAGSDDYLEKPVDPEQLMAKLSHYLPEDADRRTT